MSISSEAKVELNWWLTNLSAAFKNILSTSIDIVLYSVASKIGWGAALESQSTGGTGANRNQITTLISLK